jgi:hypothetical protein
MSYAIAPTFESNKIGVRRVYTLGMFRTLGDDLSDQMISDGYDPVIIGNLVALGATDAQLQALYDNYGAGTPEFNAAAGALQASLTPSGSIFDSSPAATSISNLLLNPTTAAPGQAIQNTVSSIISTSLGSFDLSLTSTWNSIVSMIHQTGTNLSALAATGDQQAITYKAQYNAAVAQFASAWQQAFNTTSPIATLSGIGDFSSTATTAIIVIAGTAMAATVGLPITAIVAGVLGTMYLINQYLQNSHAQIAVQQTVANTASAQAATQATVATTTQTTIASLQQQYNSVIAQMNALPATSTTQRAQLQAQAQSILSAISSLSGQLVTATTPPAASPASSTTLWLENNWGYFAAVLLAMVVLPPLVRKL